jgi:quinol monooxygenase YgiN
MSIIVIASAFPLPEYRADVIEAFEVAIPRVHEDPGCELYALHEGQDRLVMIEKYVSQDALAAHARSRELAELNASLRDKLDGDLDVQVLTPYPVGDGAKGAL